MERARRELGTAEAGESGAGKGSRQASSEIERGEPAMRSNLNVTETAQIFGNKSKEFLEAVYSLLGWRIKFDESGTDIRLTSMYAPKGKMGLTLKFASQEGHFGTMQMTGAMARGLEETRHFWLVERQSVPGFLAQITTEMFEKTTVSDTKTLVSDVLIDHRLAGLPDMSAWSDNRSSICYVAIHSLHAAWLARI